MTGAPVGVYCRAGSFAEYRRREVGVFEKHKAKKATAHYQQDLAHWQEQRDGYAGLLQLAQSYQGEPSTELMLEPGEAVFARVTDASLVEERRAGGHWQGGSAGVSVPVGSIGGRSVRYRVGATRGHYVQGTPHPTAIDTGTVFVTDTRVIFQGANQTRECTFDKLLGIQHSDEDGTTVLSVSNRQKPTTIHYGPRIAGWFDFRLDLALAHYRNTVGALVTQLEQELAALDAARPPPPPVPV
jgi:hypothetical protein